MVVMKKEISDITWHSSFQYRVKTDLGNKRVLLWRYILHRCGHPHGPFTTFLNSQRLPSSSFSSAPSCAFVFFFFWSGQTITQLVGRFVALACPSSSLEGTNTYGMPASSAITGKWEMMSMGVMSAARMRSLGKSRQ